jgi:hypothetical protein
VTALQRSRLALVLAVLLVSALGFTPTAAGAAEERESRSNITIRTAAEFDQAHGVRSGSGTVDNPYVISGWTVGTLTIKDTDAAVLITDNTIGTLVLDWIGRHADVIGNDISDLRVNQNVRRTGLPTSGRIAENTFDVVGQLRHFDGVFERNVVGTAQEGTNRLLGEFTSTRAVNFDGFNGARFRDNVIYGYVEARLHGHHHSSAFGEDSHQHAGEADMMDHSIRYHEVWITGNTITVPPGTWAALEYVDNNHAANDRTATSETNPALNDPHVHYTQVHITDNKLVGSGLQVGIFNATDERHIRTERGRVDLDNNEITVEQPTTPFFSMPPGIAVFDATDVDLYVRNNNIHGPHTDALPTDQFLSSGGGTGIDLSRIDKANVRLYDNNIGHMYYGIYASQFSDTVRWFLGGTTAEDVEEPLTYSNNVANKPEPRPAEEDTGDPDGGGHDHGG